jgi:hypothetical protein
MTDKPTYKQLEEQASYLQKKYDSLAKATRSLEIYVSTLEKRNTFLEEQLENAQLNVAQQKDNITRVALESNRVKDEMAAEITVLRSKLKVATNGDHNRLGN